MPKRDVSMSEDEVVAFLARTTEMVVGAIAEDGTPVGAQAATRYANGAIEFAFAPDAAMTNALAHDPRVTLTMDESPTYLGIVGVIAHGVATPVSAEHYRLIPDHIVSFDFGRLAT
jgi:nitroimidazol reductase NimA-like FMN-containing flavoprotein (pyridoxamine 5'-phosphate oxidase superfamily)